MAACSYVSSPVRGAIPGEEIWHERRRQKASWGCGHPWDCPSHALLIRASAAFLQSKCNLGFCCLQPKNPLKWYWPTSSCFYPQSLTEGLALTRGSVNKAWKHVCCNVESGTRWEHEHMSHCDRCMRATPQRCRVKQCFHAHSEHLFGSEFVLCICSTLLQKCWLIWLFLV